MFALIGGFPDNIVAVRGVGLISSADYRDVLAPAVDHATADGRKARLLLELGAGFEGYETSAMVADTALGVGHIGSFERMAVVTDADWMRRAISLLGPVIPGEVRLFAVAETDAARDWIRGS